MLIGSVFISTIIRAAGPNTGADKELRKERVAAAVRVCPIGTAGTNVMTVTAVPTRRPTPPRAGLGKPCRTG